MKHAIKHQKHDMKDKHGKHVNIINGSKGLLPKPKKQLSLSPKHGGHLHQTSLESDASK